MSGFGLGDALRQIAEGFREPRLGEWDLNRLADVADELQRVNDDLEDQIFEDGGFIHQVVELEEENANLHAVIQRVHALANKYAQGRGGPTAKRIRAALAGTDEQ